VNRPLHTLFPVSRTGSEDRTRWPDAWLTASCHGGAQFNFRLDILVLMPVSWLLAKGLGVVHQLLRHSGCCGTPESQRLPRKRSPSLFQYTLCSVGSHGVLRSGG